MATIEVEEEVAEELADLADAPVDNSLKVWVNATPTGISLRNSDALSDATPRHLVIERYEKQNQDFELNLKGTHPPTVNPSTSRNYAARQAGLRFFAAHSAFMIPALRPQKLNTKNVECVDPNNYLLPHARELTPSTCDGTVLHAVDLVWSKNTDSAYDGHNGGEFTH